MSKKYTLLTFKGICMNFLLELNFFILSHPVTSKQPHKVVQIHMGHPVGVVYVCVPLPTSVGPRLLKLRREYVHDFNVKLSKFTN